jgi:uncharacterized BrkB/YihY/UPF0761 family membrane protein
MATATRSRATSGPVRLSGRIVEQVRRRLPRPLRHVLDQARGQDILLCAASLGFYAIVSVVPLTILVMWILSVVLGDTPDAPARV